MSSKTPPRTCSNVQTLVEISAKLHEALNLVNSLHRDKDKDILAKLDGIAVISNALDSFLDDPKKPRAR